MHKPCTNLPHKPAQTCAHTPPSLLRREREGVVHVQGFGHFGCERVRMTGYDGHLFRQASTLDALPSRCSSASAAASTYPNRPAAERSDSMKYLTALRALRKDAPAPTKPRTNLMPLAKVASASVWADLCGQRPTALSGRQPA